MSRKIYVLDTSYLLEFFAVPRNSTEAAIKEIRKRFKDAVQSRASFFVPLPCLFELANHIADVSDGTVRYDLAARLSTTVKSSVLEQVPWTITPTTGIDEFPRLFDAYAREYVKQNIGLTDTFTISEACRLKEKYSSGLGYEVHIWTKDHSLKATEPDTEADAFLG